MPSLIDNILALEKDASTLVAAAHADAKAAAERADGEIAAARTRLAAETEARLEAFKVATDDKLKQDELAAEAEFNAACAGIAGITPDVIRTQAARVVDAFLRG